MMRVLVFMRLLVACIFALGSIWLISIGKDGWGWCVFASITLGWIDGETKKDN